MAFLVQNESGTVTGANAYVTVAYFKQYHDDRGNSYAPPLFADDPAIEKAIVKATDYLDARFRFRGTRAHGQRDQSTQWPRYDATDDDGEYIYGIPDALARACCEYALRVASAPLAPDPTNPMLGRGVKSFSQSAGPVSQSFTFESGGASYQLPRYPAADKLLSLAGLLESTSELGRA
jgi:hypothetical protein